MWPPGAFATLDSAACDPTGEKAVRPGNRSSKLVKTLMKKAELFNGFHSAAAAALALACLLAVAGCSAGPLPERDKWRFGDGQSRVLA